NLTVLSDPDAKVIREYGLLHPKGYKGEDIALRATLIIDENGREVYRRVSSSVPDLRTADEILAQLRNTQRQFRLGSQSSTDSILHLAFVEYRAGLRLQDVNSKVIG